MRVSESHFLRHHKAFVDAASQQWLHEIVPHFNMTIFDEKYHSVLCRIGWHLAQTTRFTHTTKHENKKNEGLKPEHLHEWLPIWLQYVSTLAYTGELHTLTGDAHLTSGRMEEPRYGFTTPLRVA